MERPAAYSFAEALNSGRFLVTTEETPPKGADLSEFMARVAHLRGVVDAVNLTESSGAAMTMSPLGAVPGLLELGLEPILQITCRDRNRIALQADLLAAAALGVRTVSCMAGDPIDGGDHPDAQAVHDLDTPGLLRAAAGLSDGRDLADNPLAGSPRFCLGAVANPGADDLDAEVTRLELKAEAGARFFQTQAVYDPAVFERFMRRVEGIGLPVLAGFIVLKSGAMARRLNETLPDLQVPDALIDELDAAEDRVAASIEISGRVLSRVAPMCRGLHVIAVGWESRLPRILAAAGIEQ